MKPNIKDNDVVVGLAVFCVECMETVRSATYKDMNGLTITCSSCGTHDNSSVGISVYSNSYQMLQHAYREMAKHKKMVNALLSERIRKDES